MDAVEFLKAKVKMCEALKCSSCPLSFERNGHDSACQCVQADYPEEYVAIVEKWWAENRPITNAEWVAGKLREIGFKTDVEFIRNHRCPIEFSNVFSEFSGCDKHNCCECQKWWDEEHKEE